MSFLIRTKFDGYKPDGLRTLNGKGGGGGGSSGPSAEQNSLYSAQANTINNMNAIAQPALNKSMTNLGTLADQTSNGSLQQQLTNEGQASAQSALGTNIGAMNRNMGRFGMNPSQFANDSNALALGGASMQAGAADKARMAVRDLGWQQNQAIAGMASGQNNTSVNAMQGLSSQMQGNQMFQQQQANQAAQGIGSAAAYFGSKMFKDGGPVHEPVRHMASGGLMRYGSTPAMLKPGSIPSTMSSSNFGGPSGWDTAGQIAVPLAASFGASTLKHALSSGGTPWAKTTGDALKNGASNVWNGLFGAGAGAGTEIGTNVAGQSLAGLYADGLGGADYAGAAAMSAAEYGSEAAWFDYLATAATLAADGGKINGPGTGTSDSIPAKLSDGEYVVNAEAVKLIGQKKLDKWNKQGLMIRKQQAKKPKGGLMARSA